MSVFLSRGSTLELLNEPLWHPGAVISLGSATTFEDLRDPDYVWRTQRAVRTVLGFLARNVAQVALHAFELDPDGDRRRLDAGHKLARTLRRPSPTRTPFEFMHELVVDLGLWDRYAAVKVRTEAGGVELVRLPPRLWRFKRDRFDRPVAVEYGAGPDGNPLAVPLDRVLWLDGYPTPSGSSPIEALFDLLEEQAEAAAYRSTLWRSGARFPGWIERPPEAPDWSATAKRVFREGWRQYRTGGVSEGDTPLLEDGMIYHPEPGITPSDGQQIEARKLAISEVAAAYWIPPVFVGVLDNANYSNVGAYRQMLYSDTLGPVFAEIGQAFQDRLVPDVADPDRAFVEFNVGEKLRLSFEEQAKVLGSIIGGPVMTRNEGRRRLNLGAIDRPEYDDLIVPLNLSAGDGTPAPLELDKAIAAAATLIRSGFDPVAALEAVGLDPIEHGGMVPVTVRPPEDLP